MTITQQAEINELVRSARIAGQAGLTAECAALLREAARRITDLLTAMEAPAKAGA